MDGMIPHQVVGEVRRDAGPQPYCTTDMDALRAVGEAQGRRMAKEAAAIAADCVVVDPKAWADSKALDALIHHGLSDSRRMFLADRIEGLRDAGRITFAQHRAAEEIGDLVQWIEAGKQIMARSQFSERLAASSGTIPLQHLLAEAERLRFDPWRRWARDFPVKKPDRTIEHLVRAFVVQDLGIRQLANAFCMDQRRAERLLVRALGHYAAIAGWEAVAEPA